MRLLLHSLHGDVKRMEEVNGGLVYIRRVEGKGAVNDRAVYFLGRDCWTLRRGRIAAL